MSWLLSEALSEPERVGINHHIHYSDLLFENLRMEEMEANFDCELITYQSRTHTRLQMGILGSNEYVECSASDLIGQYVGQTGPKTEGKLTEALGRVLFIDEAYRFCDGHFGTEAINELVECLTKPKFMEKIVVILAGYTHQIDDLLRVNPGRSRVGNTFRRMTRLATVRSYNVYSPPPKRSNIWYIYLANRGQATGVAIGTWLTTVQTTGTAALFFWWGF
jgi:hypothetical protein